MIKIYTTVDTTVPKVSLITTSKYCLSMVLTIYSFVFFLFWLKEYHKDDDAISSFLAILFFAFFTASFYLTKISAKVLNDKKMLIKYGAISAVIGWVFFVIELWKKPMWKKNKGLFIVALGLAIIVAVLIIYKDQSNVNVINYKDQSNLLNPCVHIFQIFQFMLAVSPISIMMFMTLCKLDDVPFLSGFIISGILTILTFKEIQGWKYRLIYSVVGVISSLIMFFILVTICQKIYKHPIYFYGLLVVFFILIGVLCHLSVNKPVENETKDMNVDNEVQSEVNVNIENETKDMNVDNEVQSEVNVNIENETKDMNVDNEVQSEVNVNIENETKDIKVENEVQSEVNVNIENETKNMKIENEI